MNTRWFWLALGGAFATTFLACWAAWVFMIQPMDAAVKTANELERIFTSEFEATPRLAANAGILFPHTYRSENLVAARRTLTVEQTLDTPLPDGTQPTLRAEFLAEAGIAGRDSIELNIRPGGREADAKLPKSKILVLETTSPPEVATPGPAWNDLSESVRARALRQLRLAARQQLLADGLLAEADLELRSRISALASQAGCRVAFPDAP
jgi:hypothetical protein